MCGVIVVDAGRSRSTCHGRDAYCQCQNRQISGRGSRTVRLGSIVTGGRGHDVYPGSGPLDGGNTLLQCGGGGLPLGLMMNSTREEQPPEVEGFL